jgi:hypothetical protein
MWRISMTEENYEELSTELDELRKSKNVDYQKEIIRTQAYYKGYTDALEDMEKQIIAYRQRMINRMRE